MQPTILDGDRLVVTHVAIEPTPGDIIVFQKGDELIAHRLLRIRHSTSGGLTWLTSGDHYLQLDPPLGTEGILGVVAAIQRGGKERRLIGRWWNFSKHLVALAAWVSISINQIAERIAHGFLHHLSMWLTSTGLALFIKVLQPARWTSIE